MGKPASGMAAAKKEQIWRDHFARQVVSGKSVAAFCRSEGLSEGGFYSWRNRLRAAGGDTVAVTKQTASAPFIDLGIVKNPIKDEQPRHAVPNPRSAASGIEMRIDLGGGIVLTIMRH